MRRQTLDARRLLSVIYCNSYAETQHNVVDADKQAELDFLGFTLFETILEQTKCKGLRSHITESESIMLKGVLLQITNPRLSINLPSHGGWCSTAPQT